MYVPYDPQKLSLKADPSQNGVSASRIHQLKGGPPLEFINQRGSASRFHQLDGGPSLEFINIQPQNWGSTSKDNFYELYVTYFRILKIRLF